MSQKIRLTQEQHEHIVKTMKDVTYWLFLASKSIIESYGWSSKVGKQAESFFLTLYPSNKLFWRLKFKIIDSVYADLDVKDPASIERLYDGIPIDDRWEGVSIYGKRPYPHRMSEDQHNQVAELLWNCRQAMIRLAIDILQKAYPKNSRILKDCFKIADKIDDLRSDLDGLFVQEYPSENPPYSPYYGQRNKDNG